eukprot:CAMPEP_0201584980 /NCGR_PEP_ID=MMETSP0190_2-20130828/116986_1 /ASSEMBLY_ACC=CAM_ASM_000263 /TAXON_ID=37353 /ORGANISM="Rosalina sp." /LENGTH=429 /DNA_ID=CAMNT_0048030047 /DNA_START=40 /DNA_END=1329 /DNA_ORIENTATION=-
MLSVLLTLFILIVAISSTKKYIATFGDNGFSGQVIVDNGMVSVDLDLSSQPDFGLTIDYETCINGGLQWHIHSWLYENDTSEKLGQECGPSRTGGHYDPWNACGPASGNEYCATSGNADDEYACIATNDYEPNLSADPYSVEVGDWSGKYGYAILDNDTFSGSFSSFYEITPDDLALDDFSVVFHCNDGTRAFCAPLLPSSEDSESTLPSQVNQKAVIAKFNTLSDDSEIILLPDGTISGTIDAEEYYSEILVTGTPGCETYEYSIFNAKSGGTLDEESSINGAECLDSIGSQYDPTRQCLPWSMDENCMNGTKLCGDPSYEYECIYATGYRYNCAPGDLSGKYGVLEPSALKQIDDDGATLLPPTDSLIGKIMVIHCSKDDVEDLEALSCAMIQEYNTMNSTLDPDDGATTYSIMVLSMIISIAVFYL